MLIWGIFKKGLSFLQMQKELLTDGFKKEAEALDKEIDQLKEGIRTTEKSFNISDVLDMASMALVDLSLYLTPQLPF